MSSTMSLSHVGGHTLSNGRNAANEWNYGLELGREVRAGYIEGGFLACRYYWKPSV